MTEDCGTNGAVKNTEITDNEKGTAAVKAKYLTTKEKFHEMVDSGGQSSDDVGQSEDSIEPVQKKIKLEDVAHREDRPARKKERGQFKSRPHMKPQMYNENKLCPSIVQERETKCFYGDRCKFLHNISEYMELKPADIGERCYLFDSFGKCRYGVACRYAKAHTSEDFQNLVNDDLWSVNKDKAMVKNNLDKELQRQLRKRQVCFKASEEYLRTLSKASNQGRATKAATENKLQQPCCAAESTQSEPLSEAEKTGVEEGIAGKETSSVTPSLPNSSGEPQQHLVEAEPVKTIGALTDIDIVKLRSCEKKQVDFKDKLYLAPLTTCGNLPFRRICKRFGADITCGEMAMCTNLLQGQSSEWALLKRHESEDFFGVQLEGCFPDTMTRCAELLNKNIEVDFVDINSGCPIDLVYKKGGGCGLMSRTRKFEQIIKGMNSVLDVPLTVKIRTGVQDKVNIAHKLIPEMKNWGVSLITLHGRSREQRYTKLADWDYIDTCSKLASPVPLFGNGDILSYEDAMKARESGVSGIMLARGALIKPWIFTEIKEQRHWDISSGERLDILKDFTHFGLEHWGSDTQGIEKTRLFMLEWLSFMCRYIPVGLLERVPQKINERPPYYIGRDYLESLMASQHVGDWIRISEMLLGPVPHNFVFLPKHKANAYK
ncbi:tRNA-dihydrouridine(47) synthase [NAD(P)(+)]-like [Conger conger]|uniref:tRNA-dihydrouridine(47) synthase [NAD(P)(+)]-like n=1 Tax=Conger conger TaxID=82655 RepID=UPI002A59F299|nr:tRNA-dihydrouridine(47) synthase [NAD(P)(+)]-like [Conger conger]XP_061110658.1 tRNA-dihydrouridine(47) synthase [NAD(P)(+)]-like [Conger conger]